jgi:hypothetical protein
MGKYFRKSSWHFVVLIGLLIVTMGANGGCGGCVTVTTPVGDTIAPQVAITITSGVSGNTIIGNTVGIKVEAADDNALSKIELYINGSKVKESQTSPLTYDWDVRGLEYSTEQKIKARAYDSSGNVGSSEEVILTVGDANAPLVTITSPAGDWVKTDEVTVKASIQDRSSKKAPSYIKKVELYVNDVLEEEKDNLDLPLVSYSYDYDIPSSTGNGTTIEFKVKAYDVKNNVGEATKAVTVDKTPPSSVVMIKPHANLEVNDGDIVNVEAKASDALSGIEKVEFYAVSGSTSSKIGTGTYDSASDSWKLAWNTSNVTSGQTYQIRAKAYDKAGNYTESTLTSATVKVNDVSAPTNVVLSVQSVGGWIGSTARFTVTAQDRAPSGLNTANLKYRKSGVTNWTSGPSGNFSGNTAIINLPTTGLDSGATYEFKAYVVDNAGNSSGDSNVVTAKVDNINPTVAFTSSAGTILNGVTTIAANPNDGTGSGISKVEFYVDNVLKHTDSVAPYDWNWDTTNVTEGPHTIKVKAYDNVNNWAEATLIVNVDRTNPTINITNPPSGGTVSGTNVSISVSASDANGISKIELYIDGVKVAESTTSPLTYSWNTTSGYSNGLHTIKAKAYDQAKPNANVSERSVTVTVNNP